MGARTGPQRPLPPVSGFFLDSPSHCWWASFYFFLLVNVWASWFGMDGGGCSPSLPFGHRRSLVYLPGMRLIRPTSTPREYGRGVHFHVPLLLLRDPLAFLFYPDGWRIIIVTLPLFFGASRDPFSLVIPALLSPGLVHLGSSRATVVDSFFLFDS